MSSLVNWFHKRRSVSEVNVKNKMSSNGTFVPMTAASNKRSGQGGREKIFKKQLSWPCQPNYAYFYLQNDGDDLLLSDHDIVYGAPSLDLMYGYKPFWTVQRRYSENSHINSPLFRGALWHHQAPPFGRMVPPDPGVVLGIAAPHMQERPQTEKVARRKSDSLFNYVPKSFSKQDASRILVGEKRDDALPLRALSSSRRFSSRTEIAPRQRDDQRGKSVPNSVVGQKQNNANVKRLPDQGRNLDKQRDLDSRESLALNNESLNFNDESLDVNQNLPDGHFYFEPSLLLDNRGQVGDGGKSSPCPGNEDGSLSHVTDKDYNINCKSADDEVSTILSEFQNTDHYNGNNNITYVRRDRNGGKRDLLY